MKVFAVNTKSGKASKSKSKSNALTSKSSISTSSPSSRFRNGSPFGIGRPTAGSLRSPNVKRWGRFYDEYGVGITVPRVNPNRVRKQREENARRIAQGKKPLLRGPFLH